MAEESPPRRGACAESKPGYLFFCFLLPWHVLRTWAGSSFPEVRAHRGCREASPLRSPREGRAAAGGTSPSRPHPNGNTELGRLLLWLLLL